MIWILGRIPLGRRVREKVERGLLQPLEARFRVLDLRSKVEFLS